MQHPKCSFAVAITMSLVPACLALVTSACAPRSATSAQKARVVGQFVQVAMGNNQGRKNARAWISAHWQPDFAPLMIESISLSPTTWDAEANLHLLERKTGKKLPGNKLDPWFVWWWKQHKQPNPAYRQFKATVYATIDPRFYRYFHQPGPAKVKLDEVRWGGVRQDGIPPLRNPHMLAADNPGTAYLHNSDTVFGIDVNGDVRAYPKRILAWHELFTATVGGVPVTGVYCTLCGSMILYDSTINGHLYRLGTSGFLYRSNKLMYDKGTQSLWSTLYGAPVIGPLASKNIRLRERSVVTTTWGAWRKRHPHTTVLDIHTGFYRDYGEGVAYHHYFNTEKLMFQVPHHDHRLQNKDDVLSLTTPDGSDPLAISDAFLAHRPVYHARVGGKRLVVLTDASGASRVYAAGGVLIKTWNQQGSATDSTGRVWKVSEHALTSGDRSLPRYPSHRTFWFGWYAAYDNTRLVK